jgi:hypothetical protein
VTRLPAHAKAVRGLVLVPEGRQLFSNMTVDENLEMGTFTGRGRIFRSPGASLHFSFRASRSAGGKRPARSRALTELGASSELNAEWAGKMLDCSTQYLAQLRKEKVINWVTASGPHSSTRRFRKISKDEQLPGRNADIQLEFPNPALSRGLLRCRVIVREMFFLKSIQMVEGSVRIGLRASCRVCARPAKCRA